LPPTVQRERVPDGGEKTTGVQPVKESGEIPVTEKEHNPF